jgi:hypothetical protein
MALKELRFDGVDGRPVKPNTTAFGLEWVLQRSAEPRIGVIKSVVVDLINPTSTTALGARLEDRLHVFVQHGGRSHQYIFAKQGKTIMETVEVLEGSGNILSITMTEPSNDFSEVFGKVLKPGDVENVILCSSSLLLRTLYAPKEQSGLVKITAEQMATSEEWKEIRRASAIPES